MIEPTERTKAFSFFSLPLSYLGNNFISLSSLYPFFYLFSALDNPYNKGKLIIYGLFFFLFCSYTFFLSRIIYFSQ